MARKIRFPLKMTDDTEVRNIDELRANFDLAAVLGYYADGKLVTWLRDRYLDSEADKIEALNKNSKSFPSDLCMALGAEIPSDFDETNSDFDLSYISRRNEKKRILRTIIDDEEIIYKVNQVALDQDDLLDIYDDGKKEIYLCQGEFEISLSVTGVTYIGIADPIVTVRATDNVNFKEKNIKFVNCVYGWDVSNTTPLDDMKRAERLLFKGEYKNAVDLLNDCAESGNPRAYVLLKHIEDFYYNSINFKYNKELESGLEICGIVQANEDECKDYKAGKNYFRLLKKLADKGDWLCEYYYAGLLLKKSNLNTQQTLDEMIRYFKASADKGNFPANLKLFYAYRKKKKCIYKNDEVVFKIISEFAESGEPLAHMHLCDIYNFEYYGVKGNKKKEVYWLTIAAENGLPRAQNILGDYYLIEYNHCGGNNITKAIEWYTKSAEQGEISPCAKLGDYFYKSNNYREAVKWYLKFFEMSNGLYGKDAFDCACGLGKCYYYGNGVTQDYDKAFELFNLVESTEKSRDPEAEFMLGEAYFNGNGVAQNKAKAIEWYAKSSNVDARYKLAEIYYYGDGVKADYEQTFKWLSTDDCCCWFSEDELRKFKEVFKRIYKAAETGNTDKQYELGFCYYYGIGTAHNYVMAQDCFEKAAENGNAKALYKIGTDPFFNGSTEEAIKLLKKSAQNGYTEAMKDLGDIYCGEIIFLFSNNVEQNYEKALKWYTMAAEHGADVEYKIKDLKRRMSKEANS